jgi:RNA polymerase sigma-70 factor (ECF subfamily)
MTSDTHNPPASESRAGPPLGELFEQHRARLRRMVRLRLDRRLRARIDESDVIQEAYVEAVQRFDAYRQNPEVPPFIWLRFLTGQKLAQMHRRHLGAQGRSVGREVQLYRGAMPSATSAALAAQLVGQHTSPSEAAERAELKIRVQDALNDMDEIDREVLALRHFEQLTNAETAQVLEISEEAAYKRYVRALKRLKGILGSAGGD